MGRSGKIWQGLGIQRDGIASSDTRQAACFSSIFLVYATWADVAFSGFEVPCYKMTLVYSEELWIRAQALW